MDSPDAPVMSRRSLRRDGRADTASTPVADGPAVADAAAAASTVATTTSGIALGWIDDDTVASRSASRDLAAASGPYALAHGDLLAVRPRRSPLRASTTVPLLSIATLAIGAYAASTLLWPLHAVSPTVSPVAVAAPAAAAAAPAWPAEGSGATAIDGLGSIAGSTADAASVASITKLVTALLILDQMPLAVGEQGPQYSFTSADRREYFAYLSDDQSALDVPVGGTLTQYQLLQGVLIGSANNYADRLIGELWPNENIYARAANAWLEQHGVGGMTIVDSSGIDPDNAADPASVIALARLAMANPVIAEIVAQRSVELPGAGLVENTNALLAEPGVVGVKTGSLTDFYNLVAARDADIDGTLVRVYAAVLGQPDDETRFAATRALLESTVAEVAASPVLAAGTVAGTVTTEWGVSSDVLTDADARVALWNGQGAEATTTFSLGDARAAGATVGELTLTGPLGSSTTPLTLLADIPDPDGWWRLTHPLQLWGLVD